MAKAAKNIESFLKTPDEQDELISEVQRLTENSVNLKLVEKDTKLSRYLSGNC